MTGHVNTHSHETVWDERNAAFFHIKLGLNIDEVCKHIASKFYLTHHKFACWYSTFSTQSTNLSLCFTGAWVYWSFMSGFLFISKLTEFPCCKNFTLSCCWWITSQSQSFDQQWSEFEENRQKIVNSVKTKNKKWKSAKTFATVLQKGQESLNPQIFPKKLCFMCCKKCCAIDAEGLYQIHKLWNSCSQMTRFWILVSTLCPDVEEIGG